MHGTYSQPFLPDDHSKVVPPLPIPNRTVKRLSADDSVHSHVKVGHRQALQYPKQKAPTNRSGLFAFSDSMLKFFYRFSALQLVLMDRSTFPSAGKVRGSSDFPVFKKATDNSLAGSAHVTMLMSPRWP